MFSYFSKKNEKSEGELSVTLLDESEEETSCLDKLYADDVCQDIDRILLSWNSMPSIIMQKKELSHYIPSVNPEYLLKIMTSDQYQRVVIDRFIEGVINYTSYFQLKVMVDSIAKLLPSDVIPVHYTFVSKISSSYGVSVLEKKLSHKEFNALWIPLASSYNEIRVKFIEIFPAYLISFLHAEARYQNIINLHEQPSSSGSWIPFVYDSHRSCFTDAELNTIFYTQQTLITEIKENYPDESSQGKIEERLNGDYFEICTFRASSLNKTWSMTKTPKEALLAWLKTEKTKRNSTGGFCSGMPSLFQKKNETEWYSSGSDDDNTSGFCSGMRSMFQKRNNDVVGNFYEDEDNENDYNNGYDSF